MLRIIGILTLLNEYRKLHRKGMAGRSVRGLNMLKKRSVKEAFFDHAGRKGQVGGSLPASSGGGAFLNFRDPKGMIRVYQEKLAHYQELVAQSGSDDRFRRLFSTGTRDTLKKGETWLAKAERHLSLLKKTADDAQAQLDRENLKEAFYGHEERPKKRKT